MLYIVYIMSRDPKSVRTMLHIHIHIHIHIHKKPMQASLRTMLLSSHSQRSGIMEPGIPAVVPIEYDELGIVFSDLKNSCT